MDLSNLRDICDLFSPDKVRDASRRDLLARAIESNNYIRKLIDLFHICEDLENVDSLHQLYEIVRSIFYLNKSSLFEVLFSEEFVLDVIGCLEYDPQLTFPDKRNYREFLDTKATFKEVIPIGNQDLLAKIHQTYRVQYIQDAILPAPSLFEENLLSTMNSFLFFNKVDIVTLLYVSGKEKAWLISTCLFSGRSKVSPTIIYHVERRKTARWQTQRPDAVPQRILCLFTNAATTESR